MKKVAICVASFLLAVSSYADCQSWVQRHYPELTDDITHEIPEIEVSGIDGFEKIKDVAHYKNADWSSVIGIARGVSLSEAEKIANENPAITFFFYTKGGHMVLEKEDGNYRAFRHGDAVFFSGKPWWGSAPGLADGYVKKD